MPALRSLIIILFNACRPSTIAGFVSSAIVDAVDRHSRQRFTHVFKERFEAIAPAVAHCDAASAIVSEVFAVWVKAPSFDADPAHVDRGVGLREGMSVFESRLTCSDCSFASATDGMSVVEMTDSDDGHGFAIALAKPSRLAVFAHLKKTKNGQSTKSLTGYILKDGHSGFPFKRLCQGAARSATFAPSRYSTTKTWVLQ